MKSGTLEVCLDVIKKRGVDLVVMGSYSGTIVQEFVIGSAVNFMLLNADCPILICR